MESTLSKNQLIAPLERIIATMPEWSLGRSISAVLKNDSLTEEELIGLHNIFRIGLDEAKNAVEQKAYRVWMNTTEKRREQEARERQTDQEEARESINFIA